GADRALLYGKQQGVRGAAVRSSIVPDGFMLGRPVDEDQRPPEGTGAPWPSQFRCETEPLRQRSHQLALINPLGTRLAGLSRTDEIVEATVEELSGGFGYAVSALVTLGPGQSLDAVALRGANVP